MKSTNLFFISLILLLSGCISFKMDEDEFRKTFAELPVMPLSDTVMIGKNTIHFVHTQRHKNELLVFVHGSPGSWSAFSDFFKNDSLAQRFDLVSLDRPGFGESDYGHAEPSLEKQVSFLAHALSGFTHHTKIWIGHSLGGPVVARMAMDFPELVQGMVLVAPSIDPEMEKYEWYRTWLSTRVIGAITPTDFWVSNEEIVPLKQELELMLPLWKEVSAPTVVVQGTKDVLVPWQNAEFARSMLADSLVDIRYLEGVNHFVPWSHPHEIIKAVLSFD